MSTERAMQRRETPAVTLESVMIDGNLAGLPDEGRLQWYRMRCEAAGLDPRAQPFQYISLNGKLTLYATKAATDQLAANRGLSVELISRELTEGEIYEAVCRVRDDSRRVTEDLGAVSVAGLKGEALANARLKACTKAKRRAILAHCGLGMLDETETDAIPGARRIQVSETGEVLGALPEPAPPVQDRDHFRRRAFAAYRSWGGVKGNSPEAAQRRREEWAQVLGIEPESAANLTDNQLRIIGDYYTAQMEQDALSVSEGREVEDADPFADAAREAVEGAEAGTYRGLIT
jgi:hypothetical protein